MQSIKQRQATLMGPRAAGRPEEVDLKRNMG